MRRSVPLPLDKEVEDEIDKAVAEPLEESAPSVSSVEVHTVNLDTIIAFENKAEKANAKEIEEGETNGRSTDEGEGRNTTVPNRSKKSRWSTIY